MSGRIMKLGAMLFVAGIQAGWGQPVISSNWVFNAASLAPEGHLNSGLAQGSVAVIGGKGLGPEQAVESGFPLVTELAGTSVAIAIEGGSVNAYVLRTSANEVRAMIPSGTPLGAAKITVSYAGVASAPAAGVIVRRNFGTFTTGDRGFGPAMAENLGSDDSRKPNSLIESARPGQVVAIRGTGLGAVTGDESQGPLPGDLDMPFRVTVGGMDAAVRYKDRSSCCAGVDEVVFEVPQGVVGCYVPVTVVAGSPNKHSSTLPAQGAVSNTGTISVSSNGGACTDPTGLSGEDLERLQTAGRARIGTILLQRQTITGPSDETDIATATFSSWDVLGFLRSRGIFGVPAAGSCIETPAEDPGLSLSGRPLDAGDQLTLQWSGEIRTLGKNADGSYGAVVGGRGGQAAFLSPNTYSIDNGAGGADIGPFSVNLRVPAPVTWTNKQAQLGLLSQTARWTGGDPDGYVLVVANLSNSTGQFRQVCTAAASAGSFVVRSPDYDAGLLEGRPYGPLFITIDLVTMPALTLFSAPGLDVGVAAVMEADRRIY